MNRDFKGVFKEDFEENFTGELGELVQDWILGYIQLKPKNCKSLLIQF